MVLLDTVAFPEIHNGSVPSRHHWKNTQTPRAPYSWHWWYLLLNAYVKIMSRSYPLFFSCTVAATLFQRELACAIARLFSENVGLAPNFILSKTMAPFPLLRQQI